MSNNIERIFSWDGLIAALEIQICKQDKIITGFHYRLKAAIVQTEPF